MALGLHPDQQGQLADPHGGWADLVAGRFGCSTQRALSTTRPTFRAARFAARFGFALEKRSGALLKEAVGRGSLGELGVERLGAEVDRILQEDSAPAALAFLETWGLLSALAPGLRFPVGFSETTGEVRAWAQRLSAWTGTPVEASTALWVFLGGLVPGALAERSWFRTQGTPGCMAACSGGRGGASQRLAAAERRSEQARALRTCRWLQLQSLGPRVAPPSVLEWWASEDEVSRQVDGR